MGHMQESLLQTRRTFHFNKNFKILDSYFTRIWQFTVLLGYCEPHIVDLFKYTMPTRLYRIIFPIMDLTSYWCWKESNNQGKT